MSTTLSRAGRSDFHTIKEAAWILGVKKPWICWAIRTGVLPAVRRRSQLVLPAAALRRLLVDSAELREAREVDQPIGGAP